VSERRKEPSENEPIVFAADEVQYDDELALIVAKGSVQITEAGRTVLPTQ